MNPFRRWLSFALAWPAQLLWGLAVTVALVISSYFVVDQPVMAFFQGRHFDHDPRLKVLTRPPELFVGLSPFVVVGALLLRCVRPWRWAEKGLLAAAVSTLTTAFAALLLKMTFGRATDGFHPFHVGHDYWMFPSGHTACTVSVTSVAGIVLPRWRALGWALAGMVGTMLIVLTHHFVGDVIGGAFLGWAIGGTVARGFGLTKSTDPH
jgi:membrane-associated phospholipid phosphatase